MAPLKSLEREHPVIDSPFQQFCASHGILSVEDFLVFDLNVLAGLAEKHSTSERLKEGITQVLSIIDSQHRLWFNGMELLEDAEQNKRLLPTGCERIDGFLQGGFREGHVTELVGPSSSGKTQVCLKAAANVAKENLGGVVYVDTGNSFSPDRVAQFVIANKEVNYNSLQNVLKNIVCHYVYDIFTLLDVLHQLKFNLTSQIYAGGRVRLLIVDSISSLITPILGATNLQGRALMVSAGSLLKKIAYEHNIAILLHRRRSKFWDNFVSKHCVSWFLREAKHSVSVSQLHSNRGVLSVRGYQPQHHHIQWVKKCRETCIPVLYLDFEIAKVTNHMVGGDGGIQKPALGESWKSIPHVRLQLSHERGNNLFHMSLLRHPYMDSGKATTFMLCEESI